jgi:hypothetical protein
MLRHLLTEYKAVWQAREIYAQIWYNGDCHCTGTYASEALYVSSEERGIEIINNFTTYSTYHVASSDVRKVEFQLPYTIPWVSKAPPAILYYTASGHVCKLYIYYKNFTII